MIKSIIFDIDNTLMDFMKMKRAAVDAAIDAMIDAGLSTPKEVMSKKIYDIYKEGIEQQDIFDKVLLQEFGAIDYRILAAGIVGYRRAKDGNMTLYPHVNMTLTQLNKRAIPMVVISDAPRLQAWLRIVSLGLQHYFEKIITFDDTNERKPSPKPFQFALDVLKTAPKETLMVGDWAERDIAGAKALGIRTAWAKYGNTFDTKESGADYELGDIYELVGIIDRENSSRPRHALERKS
ncbi:MAG: HAD-IA family hydrolase [Elusimicrobia bacterium]|nr:HAD-IA family hydrolase [Elusimicrobiota bacterium]